MGRPDEQPSEMPSYAQPASNMPSYNHPSSNMPSNDQPSSNMPSYNQPQHQQQQQTFSQPPMQNPPPTQFQPPPPPPGPVLHPPPGPQMNPADPPQKPAPYPPSQPAAYPPSQPLAYPPPQPAAYPPQNSATAFPPPSHLQDQQYPPPPPPPPPPQVYVQPGQYPPPGNPPMGYGQMPPHSPMKPVTTGFPLTAEPNSEGWTTGLFDCMDDPMNAVITFLFPCLTFGQIAEIIDNGQTSCATGAIMYALISSFVGMPCIYSCTYRTKLRAKFGLVETPAPDWIVHFVCEYCAICQAYRELNRRGLDPSLGWMGNIARNQQLQPQMAMMPPAPQRMM